MEPLERLECDTYCWDSDPDEDMGPQDSDDSAEMDAEFLRDLEPSVRRSTQLPHTLPAQLRQLSGQRRRRASNRLDEFELEMDAELEADVEASRARVVASMCTGATVVEAAAGAGGGCSAPAAADPETPSLLAIGEDPQSSADADGKVSPGAASRVQQYDPIYFDSDDDAVGDNEDASSEEDADQESSAVASKAGAESTSSTVDEAAESSGAQEKEEGARPKKKVTFACNILKSKRKRGRRCGPGSWTDRSVLSNDDLLYDPDMDEDDQKWVDDQRKQYQPSSSKLPPAAARRKTTAGGADTLPKTDAVLNCPGCMSMLCLDCQRHELYRSQYRAMFVFNCTVRDEQTLQHHQQKKKKGGRRREEGGAPQVYRPVHCTACRTDVAVYDDDDVYHFFNVISSHS